MLDCTMKVQSLVLLSLLLVAAATATAQKGDLGTAVRSDTLNKAPSVHTPAVHSKASLNATGGGRPPAGATSAESRGPVISGPEQTVSEAEREWARRKLLKETPLGDLARELKKQKEAERAQAKPTRVVLEK